MTAKTGPRPSLDSLRENPGRFSRLALAGVGLPSFRQ